jgi:hypothetical protein
MFASRTEFIKKFPYTRGWLIIFLLFSPPATLGHKRNQTTRFFVQADFEVDQLEHQCYAVMQRGALHYW